MLTKLRSRIGKPRAAHYQSFCILPCRTSPMIINMKKNIIVFTTWLIWGLAHGALAQTINPQLLTNNWEAHWLSVPGQPNRDYGVYHFRKSFELAQKPAKFIVHVSADNRYKLYVNGQMVGLGPARGDLFHWNFETIDIAPQLQAGKNVVAAVVWNYGEDRPMSQISYRTAFILQGDTEQEKVVNSDKTWKASRNEAYSPLKPELIYTYYVVGPGEQVDNARYPWGWETVNFVDSGWLAAQQINRGIPKGSDWTEWWLLVPRSIPPMELKLERLATVRSITGMALPAGFPAQPGAVNVPPRTKVKMMLDQGHLTNAYPVLTISGGKGAKVALSYAEALYVEEGSGKDWRAQQQKGNRNDIAGKRFVGVKDLVLADGGTNRTFTGLWWRTYRYVQVEVETQEEALIINDLHGIFTGYPFEQRAKFSAASPELDQIMEVGWRTARLCAGETYFDCPYYEQLQYVGDTRIQALISLFNSGDDRLVRNAIKQIDDSRLAEGVTQSRYPSHVAQEIPPFSLWWIGMVHDYWMYRPDQAFVEDRLAGVRQVLHFFQNHQYADGSLKKVPYWNFTDWAFESAGRAPMQPDGYSAAMDLQLLWAYQLAAELEDSLGMAAMGKIYRTEADKLAATIQARYWDPAKQLYTDTPQKKYYSQHTNVLAVLTGLVKGQAAKDLVEKTLADASLTQCTIYFKYYLFQAVAKVGLGNRYLDLLDDWRTQLANGLTTWAEISDVNRARSDCHAWGSSPNIEFFRIVLGIDTAAPGFARVRIEPHLGNLKQAAGSIPHPNGEISVRYDQDKQGRWTAEIALPVGTSGELVWQGQTHPLKAGEKQVIKL